MRMVFPHPVEVLGMQECFIQECWPELVLCKNVDIVRSYNDCQVDLDQYVINIFSFHNTWKMTMMSKI